MCSIDAMWCVQFIVDEFRLQPKQHPTWFRSFCFSRYTTVMRQASDKTYIFFVYTNQHTVRNTHDGIRYSFCFHLLLTQHKHDAIVSMAEEHTSNGSKAMWVRVCVCRVLTCPSHQERTIPWNVNETISSAVAFGRLVFVPLVQVMFNTSMINKFKHKVVLTSRAIFTKN